MSSSAEAQDEFVKRHQGKSRDDLVKLRRTLAAEFFARPAQFLEHHGDPKELIG